MKEVAVVLDQTEYATGKVRQTLEPEWVPLSCSERTCRSGVTCHTCERCPEHCECRKRRSLAERLGLDTFLAEEDRRLGEFRITMRSRRKSR